MRTPDDICLLCEINNATKENSHIIPKFIGKSIFGVNAVKRAYILDTNKGHLPADFTQDSVKENYLCCPNCELYFSIFFIAVTFFMSTFILLIMIINDA